MFWYGVAFDPTIVIVGHSLGASEVTGFSKTVSWTKEVVDISAIIFCNGTEDECGSSYVVWLLVAASSWSKASPITSLRHQGLEHLMLIMIIKCSNIELLQHLEQPVCWEPLTGVDFTFSTPRLMPRLYINPVGLVQVLVLGGFQNWFLELNLRGKWWLSYLYWVPRPIRRVLHFGAKNYCDTGLVAAISIILRDLIGRSSV